MTGRLTGCEELQGLLCLAKDDLYIDRGIHHARSGGFKCEGTLADMLSVHRPKEAIRKASLG